METDCENREFYSCQNKKIDEELSINIEPIDITTNIGAYVTLSAVVKSQRPSFQWFNKFGQKIPNKNESTFFIGPVKESDFGFYKLEIVDLITNQRALTRWVEVKQANQTSFEQKPQIPNGMLPKLVTTPQGGIYRVGNTVELTGHFENATHYQWFKEDMELTGCTGNSLIIVNSNLYNTGRYTLRASNSYGNKTTQQIHVSIQ